MATEYLFSNNATTTLAQSISSTATVLNVASGDGELFPSPTSGQAFAVTLVDASTGLTNEICYCTSRSGDQLTVVRGREGTNAIAWAAGDTCANYITADVMESWLQESDLNGYALQSWVTSNYVSGTASSGNASVQNIQISNYAAGLGGNQTYLQVTPPEASSFAIPSVGYGDNRWQSKGNYVASNANTSGSSGDLQISAAYYSNSSGAPYLSGYNASGTLTSYILATQDWTNGRFATLDNLSSTNNTLNENTQNLNSALNATNTQVSNLNDLKISTSTNTSGSGNTKVDSIYYSGAAGKLAIVYYDSSGNQVTKFLTVTS